METQHSFFRLPQELRELVYRYYLESPGGFVYDCQKEKLTTVDHKPIDLGLMYTCTLIAGEMRDIVLNCNTITFTTGYSDKLRLRAGIFNAVYQRLRGLQSSMMQTIVPLMTTEIEEQIGSLYPEVLDHARPGDTLKELLHGWSYNIGLEYITNTRSQGRELIKHLLQELSILPGFAGSEFNHYPIRRKIWKKMNPHTLSTLDLNPWHIPTEEELDGLAQLLDEIPARNSDHGYDETYGKDWVGPSDPSMWRFSAASMSIRFLDSLPQSKRCQIRRIVLLENHEAVSFPESHALGLIRFCQENPDLSVDRRASLWRNILLGDRAYSRSLYQRARVDQASIDVPKSSIAVGDTSRNISGWILEAQILAAAGMPANAFVLTIDGDPTPQRSSEVFQILQEERSLQLALYEARERGIHNRFVNRYDARHISPALSEAIENITLGTSPMVRCNFDPGYLISAREFFEKKETLSIWEWHKLSVEYVTPAPPLPPFDQMLRESTLWGDDRDEERRQEVRIAMKKVYEDYNQRRHRLREAGNKKAIHDLARDFQDSYEDYVFDSGDELDEEDDDSPATAVGDAEQSEVDNAASALDTPEV